MPAPTSGLIAPPAFNQQLPPPILRRHLTRYTPFPEPPVNAIPVPVAAFQADSAAATPGSISTTLPTVADGDVGLLVVVINITTATLTVTGWTTLAGPVAVSTTQQTWLLQRTMAATDSGTTLTATFSAGGRSAFGGIIIRGADTASVGVGASWSDSAGATSTTLAAVTPAADDALLVALGGTRFGSLVAGVVNPSGYGYSEYVDNTTNNGTTPLLGTWVAARPLPGSNGVVQPAISVPFVDTGATGRMTGWHVAVAPLGVGTPAAGTATLSLTAGPTDAGAASTATAALALTGSAGAGVNAAASGALALTGTGGTTSPDSGSATLALTATAGVRGAAAGTGTLALSGAGAAQGATTGTGTLVLTGTVGAGVNAAASGALTLTGTGGGTTSDAGVAVLNLTGTVTPAARATATGTLTLTLTATTDPRASIGGTATLALTGVLAQGLAATATVALTGTGGGAGPATSSAALALSGTEIARAAAAGTGSLVLSGTAVDRAAGAATGTLGISASAVGAGRGTAGGSLTLSAAATATSGGTATGSASLLLTASGGVQPSVVAGSSSLLLVASAGLAARAAAEALLVLVAGTDATAPVAGSATLSLTGFMVSITRDIEMSAVAIQQRSAWVVRAWSALALAPTDVTATAVQDGYAEAVHERGAMVLA